MKELKPCPFCGGDDIEKTGDWFHVRHLPSCYIASIDMLHENDIDEIQRWNTRTEDTKRCRNCVYYSFDHEACTSDFNMGKYVKGHEIETADVVECGSDFGCIHFERKI